MGCVAAVRDEFDTYRPGYLAGDTFDLGRSTVIIIFTLEYKDRTCYFRKIFLDIPVGKFR